MPAKIITMSQKDQDLLRVALDRAISLYRYEAAPGDITLVERIAELKERLL